MCAIDEAKAEAQATGNLMEAKLPEVVETNDLMAYAREVAKQAEVRRTAPGFVRYGPTKPDDRVLGPVDTHYDTKDVDAAGRALRGMVASEHIITVDVEPDHPFTA